MLWKVPELGTTVDFFAGIDRNFVCFLIKFHLNEWYYMNSSVLDALSILKINPFFKLVTRLFMKEIGVF